MTNQLTLFENSIIFSYTRSQAIEDGILIDVAERAEKMGILYPVALTCALWNMYVIPDESLKVQCQTIEGRLDDTLRLFRRRARSCSGDVMFFTVYYLMAPGGHKRMKLKSVCGPGDDGNAVLTIMLPEED